MARQRHTPEQIVAILRQSEAGVKTADLCRQHGISEPTFYKWKSRYGGMELSDLRCLKALEEENRRLKQIVANQALDIEALKAINSKNW